MKLNIKTRKIIDAWEFDQLVVETYGRPYCFQQQDGCKERGFERITVPWEYGDEDFTNDTIPEVINGLEEGVSMESWLARDPEQPVADDTNGHEDYVINMFWSRNFYPHISTVVNDLHERGLLAEGEYYIDIDW